MKVKIIDCVGTDEGQETMEKGNVLNRAAAVLWLKEKLAGWMLPADHLSWEWSEGKVKEMDLPDVCFIVTADGDHLDIYGIIKGE